MNIVPFAARNNALENRSMIAVRPLNADDFISYRTLRQRVLQIGDGKYFSDSYIREKAFTTDQHWREWCTEKQEHCIMGIFSDDSLVGIMGIVQYGTSEDLTVEWDDTWVAPEYRKYGVAKRGYDAVSEWTKAHGYKKALVIIREDNTRSLKIRQKQGFVYSHTRQNEAYADGSISAVHYLTKNLAASPVSQQAPYQRAVNHLEGTLRALQPDTHIGAPSQKPKTAAL